MRIQFFMIFIRLICNAIYWEVCLWKHEYNCWSSLLEQCKNFYLLETYTFIDKGVRSVTQQNGLNFYKKWTFRNIDYLVLCHIFSIKSLIFMMATAVDDHDIYTGHSIFLFLLSEKYQDRRRVWPILIFKLKLENSRKNKENHKKCTF